MALLWGAGVWAQDKTSPDDSGSTAEMGILRMRFLDSSSGVAIQPNKVIIDQSPEAYTIAPPGIVRAILSNGSHDIRIEADNYQALTATVQVDGDATLVHEFELDPVNPKEESLLEPDTAIIHGHVTDAFTGERLSGAKLTSADGTTTMSDEQGYFQVLLRVSDHRDDEIPLTELEVQREGYVTERMRRLQVVRGSRRTQQIRMEPVTSETLPAEMVRETIEELPSPAKVHLYEWVFDVTF